MEVVGPAEVGDMEEDEWCLMGQVRMLHAAQAVESAVVGLWSIRGSGSGGLSLALSFTPS